jgi:hypothetical protein
MKKTLVVLFAILIAIPAFSQFKAGIKVGASTNSISMSKAVQLTGQTANYTVQAISTADYGFHGGLFFRLTILGVYIEPEVLFATTENKYKVTNLTTATATDVSQRLNMISVPIMVGVKLGPIRLNAGPAGSVAITDPGSLIKDTNQKLETLYNKMTWGYQAGLGFDLFKKLTVDLRYEGSLQKYQTQIQNSTGIKTSLDNRPNAFLFSLGLFF